jgi:hypothetical protein
MSALERCMCVSGPLFRLGRASVVRPRSVIGLIWGSS